MTFPRVAEISRFWTEGFGEQVSVAGNDQYRDEPQQKSDVMNKLPPPSDTRSIIKFVERNI